MRPRLQRLVAVKALCSSTDALTKPGKQDYNGPRQKFIGDRRSDISASQI
jgi:hypothetical protein